MRFQSELFVKGTREGGEKTHIAKKTQQLFLKKHHGNLSLTWSTSHPDVYDHRKHACHVGIAVEGLFLKQPAVLKSKIMHMLIFLVKKETEEVKRFLESALTLEPFPKILTLTTEGVEDYEN